MKKVWKVTIDAISQTLFVCYADGTTETVELYSQAAFQHLSSLWLKTGWALKYSYNFSWLGRPIIQLPEDLLMVQEVIWRVQPEVIVETGVAHGVLVTTKASTATHPSGPAISGFTSSASRWP